MTVTKPKKPTKAQLQRKILELEAQLASTYHFADQMLHRAGPALKASGALLQITALGGLELIPPVVIKNGLSEETIAAIRKDIQRSYVWSTELKPKGVP